MTLLKFRRVTIQVAQPSARLSEEICLSEGSAGSLRGFCGGLSEGSAGVSPRVLRGSAGFCGGPRDFPRVFGGSDPMLVTLGNCWRPTTPKTQERNKNDIAKEFSTRNHKNLALRLPQIFLDKGNLGQFKGYILCLGNVGTQLEVFLLPRVEVATGALQSF